MTGVQLAEYRTRLIGLFFDNYLRSKKTINLKLYGISGLGADERAFQFLKLNADFETIQWIKPKSRESLQDYALRLGEAIDQEEEFGLLGLSFGGMVAVEISKVLQPAVTILISSAETIEDLSSLSKLLPAAGILRFLPTKAFSPPKKIAAEYFGAENKELLFEILEDSDLNFTKWAVIAMAKWKNKTRVEGLLKISGSADQLIPPKKDDKTIIIEDGQHFMIVDRADEISELINKATKSIV